MKKIFCLLLCAVMALSVCSCGKTENVTNDNSQINTDNLDIETSETAEDNTAETSASIDTKPITETETTTEEDVNKFAIGGGAFDYLKIDYKDIYCFLDQGALYDIIGKERAHDLFHGPYYDDKQKEYPMDDSGIFCRPTLLWYMASKGLLNRDELRTIVESNSKNTDGYGYGDTFTEEDIDALLFEDWKAAMPYLKSPYAFLYNDKLYTVYALYNMRDSEELQVFVKDDTYKDVWNAIKAFFKEYYAMDTKYQVIGYNFDLVDFVNQYAD